MKMRNFYILGTLLTLAAVSESGVIGTKGDHSGDGEVPLALNKFDKKLGLLPETKEGRDDFGVYDYDMGGAEPKAPPEYDYGKPGDGNIVNEPDNNKPGIIKPDKIPPRGEKPVDEDAYEPFDGEEDFDNSVGGDQGLKPPPEEDEDEDVDDDKKVPEEDNEEKHEPVDEEEKPDKEDEPKEEGDEENPDEEDEPKEEGDEENPDEEDEPKKDEEEHVLVNEDEDDEKHDEDDEKHDEDDEKHDEEPSEDDGKNGGGEESEFFSGGSMFDTPFFNLNQVQKYFSQLERALGHVFKQTLDEAALLNGTYANTTEEEVEINGKKYIVQKSVIQGADNHSSIYVEALSSKSKMNDTQEIKDVNIKNETHV